MITAEDMLVCGVIFCLQLKKEAILICVASFMGWVVGAIFIWCAKNIEVNIICLPSLSLFVLSWFNFNYTLFQGFLGRACVYLRGLMARLRGPTVVPGAQALP